MEYLADTTFHIYILGIKFCLCSQVQLYRAHTGLHLCRTSSFPLLLMEIYSYSQSKSKSSVFWGLKERCSERQYWIFVEHIQNQVWGRFLSPSLCDCRTQMQHRTYWNSFGRNWLRAIESLISVVILTDNR